MILRPMAETRRGSIYYDRQAGIAELSNRYWRFWRDLKQKDVGVISCWEENTGEYSGAKKLTGYSGA